MACQRIRIQRIPKVHFFLSVAYIILDHLASLCSQKVPVGSSNVSCRVGGQQGRSEECLPRKSKKDSRIVFFP